MFRAQKYKSKLCAQGFEDSNLTLYFSLFAPRESNDMVNTALFRAPHCSGRNTGFSGPPMDCSDAFQGFSLLALMVPTVVFSLGPVSCRRLIVCGYYLATVGCMMAEVICVDFPVSPGETPDEQQGGGGDYLTRTIAAGGRG